MSPAKKPPRPVTRWIILWDDGDLGSSVWPRKPGKGYIRCRVTPIRPATDAEIERLAKALYRDGTKDACARGLLGVTPFHLLTGETRSRWISVARAAWRRGARL